MFLNDVQVSSLRQSIIPAKGGIESFIYSLIQNDPSALPMNEIMEQVVNRCVMVRDNSDPRERVISTNAALAAGSTQAFDTLILPPITARTNLYMDLKNKGCTYVKSYGEYVDLYNKQNLPVAPNIGMDIITEPSSSAAQQSQSDFAQVATPIPAMWYIFSLSKRQQEAAQNPNSLFGSVDMVSQEMRNRSFGMGDAIEGLMWGGCPSALLNVNGTDYPLYGFANSPLIQDGGTITFSQSSPASFIQSINSLAQLLESDNIQGPYVIYYSLNLKQTVFNTPLSGQFPYATLSSFLKTLTDDYEALTPTAYLTGSGDTGTLMLMKMDPQFMTAVVGAEPQVAQLTSNPYQSKFLMFCAMAPRIMQEYYNRIGIVKATVTVTN